MNLSSCIDKINSRINALDDEGLSRSPERIRLRAEIDTIYPLLTAEIRKAPDIQLAAPLVNALYQLIYGRGISEADRGPREWRDALLDYSRQIVDAYRRHPLIPSADYLIFLRHVAAASGSQTVYEQARDEYIRTLDSYTVGYHTLSPADLLHRLAALRAVKTLFIYDRHLPEWDDIETLVTAADPALLTPSDRALRASLLAP